MMTIKRKTPKLNSSAFIILLFTILFHKVCFSVGEFKPTEAELRLLPPYCKPKAVNMNSNVGPYQKYRPLIKKWRSIIGPDYDHLHHYCIALQYINKVHTETDKAKKKFYYRKILSNINYMEKHAAKDFILNGEITYYKGKTYQLMGDIQKAITEYKKSIKFNPKFSQPYKALFDNYIELGMISEAREILKAGLRKNPKSKSLRRRISIIKKHLKQHQKKSSDK